MKKAAAFIQAYAVASGIVARISSAYFEAMLPIAPPFRPGGVQIPAHVNNGSAEFIMATRSFEKLFARVAYRYTEERK